MNEKTPHPSPDYTNLYVYLLISLITFCIYLSRWISVPPLVSIVMKGLGLLGYPIAIVSYLVTGLGMKATKENQSQEAYRQERILVYPLKFIFLLTGLLLTSDFLSRWINFPQVLVHIQNVFSLFVYPVAGGLVGLIGVQIHRTETVNPSEEHEECKKCRRAIKPVEQNAVPTDAYPLAGFWKHKASHHFGLAIGPVGNGLYYVSFCGPGGCADVTDQCTTSLYGDVRYRVHDLNTLGVKGLFRYTRYQRYESRCSRQLTRFTPIQHNRNESEGGVK